MRTYRTAGAPFQEFTVEENLRLGAHARRDGANLAADFEIVYGYFPKLKERRRQQAGTLSGGEQQMLAIGRALMMRPSCFCSTSLRFGLAPLVVQEIFNIMRVINRQQKM